MLREKSGYGYDLKIRSFLTAAFAAAFLLVTAALLSDGTSHAQRAADGDRFSPRPTTDVCAAAPAGMIGWWPGNGSGLDLAGVNNGALINGVSFAPGKVDQAFSLNAPAQQFVSVDGASHLISNTQGSITAWVNPTATTPFRMVAAFGSGADGEAVGFGISEGNVRVYHHTLPFDWVTSVSVSTDAWTFLAYTWDGTMERLYKNGSLADSRARNFNYSPGFGRIGFGFINDASVFFPGRIDEVALFDRTLTAADISSLYGSGTAGICPPCAAQPADMISWWPAEGNANDVQGPTFENGTLMNGAAFTQGKVGQAFSFDGIDDYVNIPDSPALDLTQMSMAFWFKLNETGRIHELVNKFGPEGSNTIAYGSEIGTNNIGYFRLSTNGAISGLTDVPSTTAFTAGVWYHFAGTYDGAQMKIYINGVNEGTIAKTGNIFVNDEPLRLGNYGYFSGWLMNGMLDEVILSGRAFTAQEIRDIYEAGSAGVCGTCTAAPENMDAWWTGDGNAFDIQGPTFEHGTMTGNAGYAAGRVGQAFNFSGAQGDYVEIQNDAIFNPTGSFTVDGWFYIDPAASGNINEIATLIGKSEGSTGNGWTLYFDDRGLDGRFKKLKWAVGGIVEAENAIPTAGWYHVAGTWDPAAIPRSKLYVNGIKLADSGSAEWSISHNGLNVRVGAMHWTDAYGQGNDRMNGKADEVEFISRALSPEDIQAIYNAGSAGKCRAPCYAAPQSVVGWWTGNGDTVDRIFGNDGTLVNGTAYGPGMVNEAFNLDASQQQYVTLPAAPSNLLNNSTGSITSWVNPSSVGDNDMIAVFGSGGNGEGVGLGIFGNIRIYHHTATYDWQTNTPVSPNTWTHIAYTWDQTTERIYTNGVFAESRPRNFNYVPGNARIGYGWWNDPANFFPGRIDEVMIFNNTLSQTQIAGIFAAGAAGTCMPQATSATITGRVMTPEGAGLRNATVTLNDGVTTRTVTTSSFGYYTFEDVATGETYTVGVRSRRYRFTSRQVNVTGNVTDFDFVGQE